MEIAYLHVVINHLPIMGVPIALGVLLLGVWVRESSIKRAALLAFVVIGLVTIAVYLTGEGGEDFVERIASINEEAIEDHEEMATVALIAVEVLATLSLLVFLASGGISMLVRRAIPPERHVPGLGVALVVVVAAVTSGILGYTGKLGGMISHTEFYSAQASAALGGAKAKKDAAEEAGEASEEEDEGGKRRRRRGRDH